MDTTGDGPADRVMRALSPGIVTAQEIDAPVEEVFGWHERPGALTRLTPPWQPVRVVREAGSLRDGRAELRLPGGVRWVARHHGYEPPHRFVDELESLPLRWRHEHTFTDAGDGRTRVTDRVDTSVPRGFLRAMFAYRHRQLAGDLAAHRLARTLGGGPLTVAVTGSRGLVGTALTAFLTGGGHRVIRLVRGTPSGAGERHWRPEAPDPALLDGVDAVVHLAGEPIGARFTAAHRAAVHDSRIGPTRRLAELIAAMPDPPRCLVVASAIGFYGPERGDEPLTEDSPRGAGFLAGVVADWEDASAPAEDAGVRVVRVRTGIVQSPRGGQLRLMHPLFAAGLGGRLGSGRQWMSWIGLDDLVDVYHRALVDDRLAGAVNAVAPQPVRNAVYTRALAAVLRRPAPLPVPPAGPRLLLGAEGATELAHADQRVLPSRLQEAGHVYRFPGLLGALGHVLGRTAEKPA